MLAPSFAAASSCHPDPAVATAEAVGVVAERWPEPATAVVVVIDDRFGPMMDGIAKLASGVLACDHVAVVASVGVIGRSDTNHGDPATVAVWATYRPSSVVGANLVTVTAANPGIARSLLTGLPDHVDAGSTVVVFARTGVSHSLVLDEFNQRYAEISIGGGVVQSVAVNPVRMLDPGTGDSMTAPYDVLAVIFPAEPPPGATTDADLTIRPAPVPIVASVPSPSLERVDDALQMTAASAGLVFLSAVAPITRPDASTQPGDGHGPHPPDRRHGDGQGQYETDRVETDRVEVDRRPSEGGDGRDGHCGSTEVDEERPHGVGLAADVAGCFTAVEFATHPDAPVTEANMVTATVVAFAPLFGRASGGQ